METIDCIKTRRSIRTFESKNVEIDTIERLIDIATFAPSWKNSQTTRYIAIMDKSIKDSIANNGVMGSAHNKGIIDSAPMVMAIATINSRSGYERDGSPSTSKGSHWQSFDAGIATQTMCLAAHDMGLSTVIMGIIDEDAIKRILSLDDTLSISALVAIGYSNVDAPQPMRKTATDLLTIK